MRWEEHGREDVERREVVIEEMRRILISLPVPCPPMLEAVLGYPGQSRWVAFYWTKRGKELLCDDGYWTDACEKTAWSFTEHPAVSPALEGLYFGGGGTVAQSYLLLDRKERRLYAGAMLPVVRLLVAQHGGPPSEEQRDKRWRRALHQMSCEASVPYPPQTISAWKEEQLAKETEMRVWLDGQGKPQDEEAPEEESPQAEVTP